MATRTRLTRAEQDAKLEALHERLTEAVSGLVSGEDWKRAIEFAARFRSRSFNNTLLIYVQHYAAFEKGCNLDPMPTYVAGFKQWLSMGRSVVKGQSWLSDSPPPSRLAASATPEVEDSWRRLGRGERPAWGETVRSKLVGLRPAYVFDISQTDGDPVPGDQATHAASGASTRGGCGMGSPRR